jgi:hypothetical protein
MMQDELEAFHRWSKADQAETIFCRELANWRKLEALRGALTPAPMDMPVPCSL